MTTVVNISRKNGKKIEKYDVLIDRRTPFGNPHTIGYCRECNKVHDRKEAIEMFRKDFYECLNDDEFKKEVLKLKGLRLGCWCVPLLCHGNVIKEYLDNFNGI